MYSCSDVCVRVGRIESRPFTVGIGIRQGCVLSSLFFSHHQGWPNYGPRAASGLATSLIRPVKYLSLFFKCNVSDCGQHCNSINCWLPRKSHCIWPSSGQVVANSALGWKRLATPGLLYMNWINSHSWVEEGVTFVSCSINRLLFAEDLLPLASSQSGSQHALGRFSAACDRARKKIISNNTEVLCPSTNQRQCMLQVSRIRCSRWRNSST